ncbi:UNVERIFIED_CONTAM: hypothetical protein PYX00_000724 [Menopon gallinae]|uniref:Bis(5'-nucleosyl)-tetraphosphatase [asymmetrical] n=1 Tax=Menopon gallinae TaxID=328185 RepID=A0AAW2I9Q5_9NEOP
MKEIEYLLLQTSYGEHHWTPPKGHVDKGESDFETALRETREESGYTAADLKINKEYTKVLKYKVKGNPKIVTYWLAELSSNKPVKLSSEHQAFKWAKLEEACKLSAFPDMQQLLRDTSEYLKSKA